MSPQLKLTPEARALLDAEKRAPFLALLKRARLPAPTLEHHFHDTREWRFDFSWPDAKLALEVEGGAFKAGGSRHTRGAGFRRDCEKYSVAATLGWRILRVLPEQLATLRTVEWVATALTIYSERQMPPGVQHYTHAAPQALL